MKKLFLVTLAFFPLMGFAIDQEATKQMMVDDLGFIKNTFEVMYAPAGWKKEQYGWDLDTEIEKVKTRIQSNPKISTKDYQREISQFLRTTKDYHVGVLFHSTESASLPFTVKSSEGKYFITSINKEQLSSANFPVSIGDEIVKFGGKPIADVIADLKMNEIGDATATTDQCLAEMILTYRSGMSGMIVPRGPINITVNSAASGKTSTFQLIWKYTPEKINSDMSMSPFEDHLDLQNEKLSKHPIFHKKMLTPLYATFAKKEKSSPSDPHNLGSRVSFIPPLGTKLWESDEDSPFDAYLFKTSDRKIIGYIRIPHYMGSEKNVEAFANIIDLFNSMTDALVIDQVNNPGGLIFYSYALASALTDKPLATPKHRMAITQEEVADAIAIIPILELIENDQEAKDVMGESLMGYPVSYQFVQFALEFFRSVIDDWNGKEYLTQPHFLYGLDQINPHPTSRYTKPILLLVNSLDFSCGDFFPAILQDNNRVTILGTRTAGAGGYVLGFGYPNRFGLAVLHFTGSIAERIDKKPIENLGVTPDIQYELTKYDLQNNYSQYVSTILNAITEMVK